MKTATFLPVPWFRNRRMRLRCAMVGPLAAATAGVLVACWAVLPVTGDGRHASADEVGGRPVAPAGSQQPVTLRDRLIFGLEARIPSEVEFVDHTVEAVEEGKLPQRIVDQTFFWARQRAYLPRGNEVRRPIIYFRFAMAIRARRLGVDL